MPCYTEPYRDETAAFFIDLLCQACKKLTIEEMQSIVATEKGNTPYPLIEWYKKHVANDIGWNWDKHDKSKAHEEAKRIGLKYKTSNSAE